MHVRCAAQIASLAKVDYAPLALHLTLQRVGEDGIADQVIQLVHGNGCWHFQIDGLDVVMDIYSTEDIQFLYQLGEVRCDHLQHLPMHRAETDQQRKTPAYQAR